MVKKSNAETVDEIMEATDRAIINVRNGTLEACAQLCEDLGELGANGHYCAAAIRHMQASMPRKMMATAEAAIEKGRDGDQSSVAVPAWMIAKAR